MLRSALDVVRVAAPVAIALALAARAFDRPAGAGPGAYPRKMECQKVGADRLRCYFG